MRLGFLKTKRIYLIANMTLFHIAKYRLIKSYKLQHLLCQHLAFNAQIYLIIRTRPSLISILCILQTAAIINHLGTWITFILVQLYYNGDYLYIWTWI